MGLLGCKDISDCTGGGLSGPAFRLGSTGGLFL